jgi:hypothetical protein
MSAPSGTERDSTDAPSLAWATIASTRCFGQPVTATSGKVSAASADL